MPLSKARDRERKRMARSVQPNSNLTAPVLVQPKPIVIPGLLMDGNKIVGVGHRPVVQPTSNLTDDVPLYDPSRHRPGDKVRIRDFAGRLKVVTIPDLDGAGQPMW